MEEKKEGIRTIIGGDFMQGLEREKRRNQKGRKGWKRREEEIKR